MKKKPPMLKEKILYGAIELFIEKGIEKVTTRELAGHLGISRSHIYHYFHDWEMLCKEAMALFLHTEVAACAVSIACLEPEQRLRAFVVNYLSDTPEANWQLYGSLWQLAAHDAGWKQIAQSMMAKWREMLAEIISAGISAGEYKIVDVDRVTRQLSALLNGFLDWLIIEPSPDAFQETIRDVEVFIDMALRKAPH